MSEEFFYDYKKQDRYFKVYEPFILFLSPQETLLLCFLIRKEIRFADESGWFYCTSKTLTNKFGISVDRQIDWFSGLVKKGLVKIQHRPHPKKPNIKKVRFVKINHAEINRQCFEAQTGKSLNHS